MIPSSLSFSACSFSVFPGIASHAEHRAIPFVPTSVDANVFVMAESEKMTVAERLKRLTDAFTVNGLIGGSLQAVHHAEHEIGQFIVNTYFGQNVLFDSFRGLLIDTLTTANQQISQWLAQGSTKLQDFVGIFLEPVSALSSLRSALPKGVSA